MRLISALAALLAAAGIAEAAAAKEPLVLEPSSRWELDYAKDSCALRRMFGEGEQRAQLEMRRFQPGYGLQTTIGTNAMRITQRTMRYRFDSTGEWRDPGLVNYAYFSDDYEGVIFMMGWAAPFLDPDTPEEVRQSRTMADYVLLESEAGAKVENITISKAFRDDLVLKTGSLKAPLAALNTCIDELLTHWGIDVEAHKSLTRPATAKNVEAMGRLIPYPPKMLARRLPGIVNVRLGVEETGAVGGCYIQMDLSDPAFEEATCRTLQRALKFDPALDKDGKPIASYWINRVNFRP